MDIRTPLRTKIRISDGNGWAAGAEGIYLGYSAQYDSVKVGFVDADGNYTGEHTRVPRSAATVMTETPARKPAGKPATAIARALAALGLIQGKDFRVAGRYVKRERVWTYAYALNKEAETVIADNADTVEAIAAAEGFPFRVSVMWYQVAGREPVQHLTVDNSSLPRVREERPTTTPATADVVEDVTDPVETMDATPEPRSIVTRVADLNPEARYALWVCDAETRRPGVLHNACYGHSVHVTGTGAEIRGPLGAYLHAYAELVG